ncbi:hypothetical protein C5167_042797 [Papaver somniferum]|uniref:Large ribosomal subunit protein eL14 domain-containing protein n=1 Tax=Papaver somniferum TaxID=3469 RepID=A0A4Y7L6F9_PAPSO|nr:hypothetical protein C5167_042797 [Papaver somniferum]
MPFKRYVEIGRVALVNYGEDYGKLVVIVDVIDQNRALVDAPDMERSQMNFKRLSLTDIKIDIGRIPKKKALIDAMEAAGKLLRKLCTDVKKKWESSSWGRKLIVQKKRASLNDFDRFKVMLAKIKLTSVVGIRPADTGTWIGYARYFAIPSVLLFFDKQRFLFNAGEVFFEDLGRFKYEEDF